MVMTGCEASPRALAICNSKVAGKLIKFIRKCMKEMREREINNGRFAMFAAIGIIVAELYTGKDAIEQFGL